MITNETAINNQEFDMQQAREQVAKAVQDQEMKLEQIKQVEAELEQKELDAEFRQAEQDRIERVAQDHKETIERMGE